MSFVRVLVRSGILVLFGFAAVVAMTILFSAQMRFDQHAELQMKGVRAPRTASAMMATAATSMSTQADEETLSSAASSAAREAELNTDPPPAGEPDVRDTTASVRLTPLTPTQIAGLMGITPEPRSAPEATLAEGKKAVTIRVNKAEGALDTSGAGWVDVVLTRQFANDVAVNDVVVQNARVLAVDRSADIDRGERASTDAVTLEVDTEDAQKQLLLASRFGTLSLILRASGDHSVHEARQVGVSDLIKAAPTPEPDDDRFTSVRINRPGTEPTVHRVPKER